METTPGSTMDEILGGYLGPIDKVEKTTNDIDGLLELLIPILNAFIEFINFIKEALGMA